MRQAAVIASATVVVLAAAVLGLFLWLRGYDPIEASPPITPGGGLGAFVEPTLGSGGKPVLIPVYKPGRDFDTSFTIHNTGRFAVTIEDVADGGSGPIVPTGLHKLHDLRLEPRNSAIVVVRWRLDCTGAGGQVASDHVRLRYRYLSLFTRTASVELPFAVTLRCSGGPPATP